MVTTTKERTPSPAVHEEQRAPKAAEQKPPEPRRGTARGALGILEIAAGIAVIIVSFFAGVVLSVFLGVVVLFAGVIEAVVGAFQRATAHIVIGILGAIAGVYILANPLVTLGLLTLLVGAYLVVSGIASAYRARRIGTSAWGGVIEALIGLVALFSGINIGFLAGLYLLVRGIITYNTRMLPARSGM